MATPHEYYLSVIGKGFDTDGYGYQCVAGFKEFCKSQLGLDYYGKSICYGGNPSGYAYRIWYNFDSLGLGEYFDKVPANQMVDGDWDVWDYGSKPCPYSHIAMFRKDNGNGTGIFLGQNQGVDGGRFSQVNISYSGILGALRPKIYHLAPTKDIDTVAREVINGDWGNGEERKQRLTEAGYNYDEVQARVNEILAEEQGDLKVGTRVRSTGIGNGSSEGDSNVAIAGAEGTITRIREGYPYPYLVSDDQGALGWYKAEDLEII